jgi:hypothetical protein
VAPPTDTLVEAETRKQIDEKLLAAGWLVQDKAHINLMAAVGVAGREMPTDTGPAEYMLFIAGKACGIIEAKHEGTSLGHVAEQSARYATSNTKHIQRWAADDEPLPFLFEATNHVIRFRDERDLAPRSRYVFHFHKPETLKDLLEQGDTFRARLQHLPELNKSKHAKGNKLPYLRNINVRWGPVDTRDVSEMFFKDDELERYNLEAGDVLVCEGGEPGRASVWHGEIENMKYQKALHRVRFYSPLNPEYLALLLEYFASTGLLSRYFTGSTIKHFTKESFTSLPFPLPSLAEMEVVVSLVDEKIISIKRLESEIDKQLIKAEKNKQSILALAFSRKTL